MDSFYLPDEDLDFVSSFNHFDDCMSTECNKDDLCLFGSSTDSATQLLTKCEEVLEPTPIAQNKVTVVDKLPITATSWQLDDSFLYSLRDLLKGFQRGGATPNQNSTVCQANISNINGNYYAGFQSGAICRASENTELLDVVTDLESASDGEDSMTATSSQGTRRELWNQRYQELIEYKEKYGNCLVPLNWPSNPSLAHWVKRQRYLFRMQQEGKSSTLMGTRQKALESLGFVWDSHAAGWGERWEELRQFKEQYGHCNVPKKYPQNQQLAVWVKCQRRQFKLYSLGRNSNITLDRIEKLNTLGFVFDPRSRKRTPMV